MKNVPTTTQNSQKVGDNSKNVGESDGFIVGLKVGLGTILHFSTNALSQMVSLEHSTSIGN